MLGSRMPGRVLSEPEVQPTEVPATVVLAGMPAEGMSATKMSATRVAASAPVLRLYRAELTDYTQQDRQDRKDARRPHQEGSSSGHGLPPQ